MTKNNITYTIVTMKHDLTKRPRLYVDDDLSNNAEIPLNEPHARYLLSVMRQREGDTIRVFNGRHGEYSGDLIPLSKKKAMLKNLRLLVAQPEPKGEIHLYFAPIKKDRLPFLVEKAVELGVTDLYPVLSAHTENRKPNMEKIKAYIIEATEQCERLDIPVLHPIQNMVTCDFYDPTFAAIERKDYSLFESSQSKLGLMIGPEGGWSEEEKSFLLNHNNIRPVSLGSLILRAETAALYMLAKIA